MTGIMHLEELDNFVEENHPGVYEAIKKQVIDAVKFSDEKGLMPEIFRLPINMPWRETFQLEKRLGEMGFDSFHRYVGDKKDIACYLLSTAFGTWEGDIPRNIGLYLTVPPKQHLRI